jgi:hypothetical protein
LMLLMLATTLRGGGATPSAFSRGVENQTAGVPDWLAPWECTLYKKKIGIVGTSEKNRNYGNISIFKNSELWELIKKNWNYGNI